MKSLTQHLTEAFQPVLFPDPDYAYVFTIIKPGFLDKAQDIIDIFAKHDWQIEAMRTTKLLRSQAEDLYSIHKDEEWYDNLCDYMSSDLSQAIIYKRLSSNRTDQFEEVAKLKDDIRNMWGIDDCRNVMHSSDSFANMEHEAKIYF